MKNDCDDQDLHNKDNVQRYLTYIFFFYCCSVTVVPIILFDQSGGREITGERRGRGKQRNMNRGLMGMEHEGEGMWELGEQGRGEQWGKRRDNCN